MVSFLHIFFVLIRIVCWLRLLNICGCDNILRKIYQNFKNIPHGNACQIAFFLLHETFIKSYEHCFPFKLMKANYNNRKVWLTAALKKSIKNKHGLYLKSKKHPTLQNEKNYKQYKRLLSSCLKKAERDHYERLFNSNKNNLKNCWSIIKNCY